MVIRLRRPETPTHPRRTSYSGSRETTLNILHFQPAVSSEVPWAQAMAQMVVSDVESDLQALALLSADQE